MKSVAEKAMNKNISIMIVDDDPSMLKYTKHLLKRLGFEKIVEAGDGETALQRLSDEKVDLILSDWKMPDMDGLKLFQMLQTNLKFSGILFLMVTSSNQRSDVIAAAQHGVKHYIVKPFDGETLKSKLGQMLGDKIAN